LFLGFQSYPFPLRDSDEIDISQRRKLQELFSDNPKIKWAREGAPTIQTGDTIQFTHVSIQNYFVAKVLIQDLKDLNPEGEAIVHTYLNDRLLSAED